MWKKTHCVQASVPLETSSLIKSNPIYRAQNGGVNHRSTSKSVASKTAVSSPSSNNAQENFISGLLQQIKLLELEVAYLGKGRGNAASSPTRRSRPARSRRRCCSTAVPAFPCVWSPAPAVIRLPIPTLKLSYKIFPSVICNKSGQLSGFLVMTCF